LLAATCIITIASCLAGLAYNVVTLRVAFSGDFEDVAELKKAPYFYQAFYAMSAICVTFYLSLIVSSVGLMAGNARSLLPFTVAMTLEVVYIVSVRALWKHPTKGYSVASATGVANGGLMFQFIILLPVWAPVVLWAAR
jgi:hypothetical protein